jgi:hypothetical protein|tara:strand:+ start:1203 stop:1400 length:198 start_codon:yes stop_codon:yes gene_type:complete
MQKTNKFSSLVEQLAKVWWDWMKADTLCRDSTIECSARAKAAHQCEELIRKEYELIESMDGFFNE